jgi:hypothetical protein
MPALAALAFVYLLTTLRGQFREARDWVFLALLAGMTVLGAVAASYTVVAYIAEPQARELGIVRETVSRIPDDVSTVTIVNSTFDQTLAPFVHADEFGYPSTALPWSRTELTWLALLEARDASDTTAVRVLEASGNEGAAETVIDWGAVLRSRTGR